MLKTVALIGLGYQSVKVHLPAILNSKQLRLVGVVEVDVERAKSLPDLAAIPVFTNVDELLAEVKPDLAVIALPHHLHFEVTKKLVTNGIHVLKEKPLAINVGESKKIIEFAEKNQVLLAVNTQRRLYPHFLRLGEFINRVGKVQQIVGSYHFFVDLGKHWRDQKKFSGGGVVLDMGYHMIDILVCHFGLPKSVFCQLDTSLNSDLTENSAAIVFNYKSGIIGNIYLSKSNPPYHEELKIIGSKGIVVATDQAIELLDFNGQCLDRVAYQFIQPISTVEYFALAIDDHVPNTLGARSNLEIMIFIEACYKSWQKGKPIRIPISKKRTAYLPQTSFTDQLLFNNNLMLTRSSDRNFSNFLFKSKNKILDKFFALKQHLLSDDQDFRIWDYQFNQPAGLDYFAGKVAIITGASSGIGLATAKLLNQLGVRVIMISSRISRLEKAQNSLKNPENSFIYNCNLELEGEIDQLFTKIIKIEPKINFFVHCAGVSKSLPLDSEKSDGFDEDWQINAKSFYLILLRLKNNIVPTGSIVSIASIRARGGSPTGLGYAAAKAGVISLTQSAALQLAKKNIRANCVVPGATYPTDMSINWPPALIQKIISGIPLKKMATPEDIANVIKFLLSNESAHITGQTIDVNGGEVMK